MRFERLLFWELPRRHQWLDYHQPYTVVFRIFGLAFNYFCGYQCRIATIYDFEMLGFMDRWALLAPSFI